jgi:CubicO group peptidase (beta-lactamase class C family)
MKSISLALVFFISQVLLAQTTKYDSLLNYYNSEKHFSGSLLVATDGNIEFAKAISNPDSKNNQTIDVKSKFRIASVSKTFTAVLIMKLVEENKIDLDSTIHHYFPKYKGPGGNKVTIDQLLTYSSGIENKLEDLGLGPYQTKVSLEDFIDKYCSGNLINKPGEKYLYGNTEYIILHKIIENVSQKRFENYLQEVILTPMGMENTGVTNSNNLKTELTESFFINQERKILEVEETYFPELFFGSANMYSTVEDLLRFDQGIFNNLLLSEKSISKLLTVKQELGYTAYGLWGSSGWGKINEPFYYRTGGILGSRANWIHTIDSKKTIIVLSNNNINDLYKLSEELYQLSLDN